MSPRIPLDMQKIETFCQKWKIGEFSLFGSVLRADFGPKSDVDVLVNFEDGAPWSLWGLLKMRDELRALFGRDVDLVEKKALKNPFRRKGILSSSEVFYAA